jgi:hypothetical protein
LIVGEKERKIKEGLRMMGLNDSVYWYVYVDYISLASIPLNSLITHSYITFVF